MSSPTGAAAAPAVPHRLGHRANSLGAANAIDYAIQFLLPVVLVRYLTPEAFGSYRLLWLVAGTVMAVVTQAMAGGLYYFLPRSGDEEKRLYINQALLYLSAAGLIAACAVSGWNPWLPQNVRELSSNGALLPTFVMFWVVSSLLDLIGSTEERVRWQTRTIIGLSALRAVALSAAAVLTRQLEPVLLTLLGFAICARAGGLAGAAVGSVTAIYLEHVGTLWRISRCTGIPWRHLQDWRSLGLLLLCATLAGVISWAVVSRVPAGFGPQLRVAGGGVLLAVAYLALIVMCGLARDWRAAFEGHAAQAMRREAVSGGAARCD